VRRTGHATARRRTTPVRSGDRHLRYPRGSDGRREVSGDPAGRSVDAPTRWLSGSSPARFSIDSSAPRRDGVRTSADLPRWDVDDEPDLTTSIQPVTSGGPTGTPGSPIPLSRRPPQRDPAARCGYRGDPPPQHGSTPRRRSAETPVLARRSRTPSPRVTTAQLSSRRPSVTSPTARPARPRDGAERTGISPSSASTRIVSAPPDRPAAQPVPVGGATRRPVSRG
jgi:hypothetical protein